MEKFFPLRLADTRAGRNLREVGSIPGKEHTGWPRRPRNLEEYGQNNAKESDFYSSVEKRREFYYGRVTLNRERKIEGKVMLFNSSGSVSGPV